jgi:hypothetical protein
MTGDRIERALRERGPRELGAVIPPLPADVQETKAHLRAVDRRRSLRVLAGGTLGTLAVAAAAVAVAVAITSPPTVSPLDTGSGSSSATPSAASETAQPSNSTAPVVAACQPADVAAQASEWGAAAGSRGMMVTVTNTSSTDCLVSGSPGARLANASGTLAQVTGAPGNSPALRVAPGASVTTVVLWSNWCDPIPAGPIAVTVIIPSGEVAVTPDTVHPDVLVPPCMGPDGVNTLSTGDFQRP